MLLIRNESEHLEEIEMPFKKPASEEAVLKQLSNLNISTIGSSKLIINDVDMVTVEDVSDVESSDESENKWFVFLFRHCLFVNCLITSKICIAIYSLYYLDLSHLLL